MVNAKAISFGVLLAGLESVVAQTAPGFSVQASEQSLNVTYGTNVVDPAGETMPRAGMYPPY